MHESLVYKSRFFYSVNLTKFKLGPACSDYTAPVHTRAHTGCRVHLYNCGLNLMYILIEVTKYKQFQVYNKCTHFFKIFFFFMKYIDIFLIGLCYMHNM